MQKISDSTGTANAAGEFTEGSPAAGADATLIKSNWLNTIQRELVALVQGAGIALSKDDDGQVFKAVRALIDSASDFLKLKNLPTTLSGYGITDGFATSIIANDYNLLIKSGLYLLGSGFTPNRPPGFSGSAAFVHVATDGYGFILSYDLGEEGLAFRKVVPGGFTAWRPIWSAANFDPAAKADKAAMDVALNLKASLSGSTFVGPVTVPSLPLGTNNGFAANTAFVQAAIANLVSAAPGSLDTLKELADALGGDPNFATTVLNALAGKAGKATSLAGYGVAVATLPEIFAGADNTKPITPAGLAAMVAAIDPWAMVPIGVPVPLLNNLAGVTVPPTSRGYRYITLTASDPYNSGVLMSEVVTGSFPLVTASAVVSLAGSPMNGQTVSLINTEQRLLRGALIPGQTLQDAQQNITGSLGYACVSSASGAFTFSRVDAGPSLGVGNATGTVSLDASLVARTATETRVKSIGVVYIMRVK